MSNRITQIISLTFSAVVIALAGCSQDPGPPPALAVEQIPAELERTFKLAKQETKDLVTRVSTGLQAKDYPAAYDAVQALGSVPDATTDQRTLTARATLTIYGLLQTAQAQGDENAAATLRHHQTTK